MQPSGNRLATRPQLEPRFVQACAVTALALAVLTRLPFFTGLRFPLNDGGLLLAMVDAVRDAGFALPHSVHWNGLELPFAQPPAALYLTAALASILGVDTLSVQIWLPLVFNFASVVLFVFVAARLVENRAMLFFAAAAMPLVPSSYEWLIMGGGLTRSPGLFLTLVALALAVRIPEAIDARGRSSLTFGLALVLATTVLTHLAWAMTAYASCAIYLLDRQNDPSQRRRVLDLGVGMVVLSSPWWLTVLARHGADPFLAATVAGGFESTLFWQHAFPGQLGALHVSSFGALAAVGFAIALAQGRRFPVLWLLATCAISPQLGATASSLPLALLIAIAATSACDRIAEATRAQRELLIARGAELPGIPLIPVATFVALFALINLDTVALQRSPALAAISDDERAGMDWIRAHTEADARFLVVSDAPDATLDRRAEWFPRLAGRTAANSAEGLQWIRDGGFADARRRGDLHRLATASHPDAAPRVGREMFGGDHTHVAVFAAAGDPLLASYDASSRYERIHQEPRLTVYRARTLLASTIEPMPR